MAGMSSPYGQGIQYWQAVQGTDGYFSIVCAVSSKSANLFRTRIDRREGTDIVLQMFHLGHAAQHTVNTL